MYFSVYEVAKSSRLEPKKFTEFALANDMKYGVELHAWGEIVVDSFRMDDLVKDFSRQFEEHCNMPSSEDDDADCPWRPLDVFRVDREGKRIWSRDNPKWKEEPPVVRRRLP